MKRVIGSVAVCLLFSVSPVITYAQAQLTDGSSDQKGNVYDTYSHSRSDSVNGLLLSQEHRGVVTTFVQSLLDIAAQEKPNSSRALEIHDIADTQRHSEPRMTTAIETIGPRGSLKSFLYGSDTTSVEIIRNEIVKTQDALTRLESLFSDTSELVATTSVAIQIAALKTDLSHVQDFVAEHSTANGFLDWVGI
jgi:hypothetical protein